MRGHGDNTAHAEAVARRLELLGRELRPLRDGEVGDEIPEHTHLRELRHRVEATGEMGEGPPSIPMPGRHARRRGDRPSPSPQPWSPRGLLAGRIDFGPAQMAVVAVALAVGLSVTAWWVIRDDAGEPIPASSSTPMATPAVPSGGVTAPGTTPESGASSGTPAAPSSGIGGTGEVVVDVAGKVRRPGIVVLPSGSRVADALKAAGGAQHGVNLTDVNLARILVDGEQILVGSKPVPGTAPSLATSPAPGAGTALVNLNTATMEELETLPGVGPVTAQSIIDWRTQHGGFASVDQLLDVDGIGEKTLADLAPLVTI